MRNVVPVLLMLSMAACEAGDLSRPFGQVVALPEPEVEMVLPTGYAAEAVGRGLDDPRAVAFDRSGTPHVLEGRPARLSLLAPDGSLVPIATGGGNGPWTGVARVGDIFYVAEAGGPLGGRVLKVGPDGGLSQVGERLPAGGVVGPLAAGADGHLYLGVATAARGEQAGGRDVPCQDVRLQGGARVKGAVPCTGSVLRIDPASGDAEVRAWGFGDPVGLAFTPEGRLLVADDTPPGGGLVWDAVPGVWYGWPDYLGQTASADPLLAVHPNPPPPPVAELNGDVAAVAVPDGLAFGGPAQAFVALSPPEGPATIAFATIDSGVTVPFAANLGRPTALAFSPDGSALWVTDAQTGQLWRIQAISSTERLIVP